MVVIRILSGNLYGIFADLTLQSYCEVTSVLKMIVATHDSAFPGSGGIGAVYAF